MSAQAVTVARRWIGTPYLHQASVEGVGCDCLGLLRGIWRALYGQEPEILPAYTPDWSEPQGRERLLDAARRHMLAADDGPWSPGQVLVFRMRRGAVAKHIGILSAVGHSSKFIHAYQGHGVVESALSAPWRNRVASRLVFPERF